MLDVCEQGDEKIEIGSVQQGAGRQRPFALLVRTMVIGLPSLAAVFLLMLLARVLPASAAEGEARVVSDSVMMWGFIGAASSTGIGALAAAYAVSHIGAAAMGAMGERPEIAGRALIFVGLAEGLAIYGLIISVMILARLG